MKARYLATASFPRKAFTLAEIIVTLAVGSLLLITAMYYLYSVVNVWTRTQKDPEFEEHVQSVSAYLQFLFSQSVDSYAVKNKVSTPAKDNRKDEISPKTLSSSPDKDQGKMKTELPIAWKHLPDTSTLEEPLLSFNIYNATPFLQLPKLPIYTITAYLDFDPEKGLSLLWHYPEKNYSVDKDAFTIYRSPLSTWVKKVRYLYLKDSDKSWSFKDKPPTEKGIDTTPLYIELTFESNSSENVVLLEIQKELVIENVF